MRILYVEDDPWHRMSMSSFLDQWGYAVDSTGSLREAEELASAVEYSVILMDWMLPDGSGVEFVTQLRERGYDGWILMLTARCDSENVVKGLGSGADDYVTKPFRIREVKARIDAGVRRLAEKTERRTSNSKIRIGDLVLDKEYQRLYSSSGILIPLSRLEFATIFMLMVRSPEIVTQIEFKTEVWANPFADSGASIYSLMHRIRRKLENADITKISIEAVYDKGYRLIEH